MDSSQEIIKRIQNDKTFRRSLCRQSFYWFFHTYFSHYITYPTADFQREIFALLEDPKIKTVAIVAFRTSAKSTIATLAYVIWSMLGTPKKKYILVVSQTQNLSRQIHTNIKQELEFNSLLVSDFGPFSEEADEWRANSVVIPQYGTRITAISASEGTRGLRHMQYRPDLVIVDDVEDTELVKTKENRNSIWDWLTSEIIPIGDETTKYVYVGNMLHEDSLMMRIKQSIKNNTMEGIYRQYPLIDDKGKVLWKSRFPTQKKIDQLRKKVGSESAFYREYLLKIIADEDRVIQKDWIQYYSELPNTQENPPWLIAIGVDLAISDKSTSDLTSFVVTYVTGYGKNLRVYILPYITNKRMKHPQIIEELVQLNNRIYAEFKRYPKIFVENVAYQAAVVQQLEVERILAEPVNVAKIDKRSRLSITSPYVQTGKVLFPRNGASDLISQITNFGIEKHDDLADAFSILVMKVIENDRPAPAHLPDEPVVNKPIYRNFGDGPVDVSKPITAGLWNKKF